MRSLLPVLGPRGPPGVQRRQRQQRSQDHLADLSRTLGLVASMLISDQFCDQNDGTDERLT